MTTTAPPLAFADLSAELEIPAHGILSRTIHADAAVKVTLFAFDAGQELSEHAAAMPAIVQILRGEALMELDGASSELRAGGWVYMPAGLRHSLIARTPVVMLLTMLRGWHQRPAA
jgi:quercetin dioxygenase-like cupin family protein